MLEARSVSYRRCGRTLVRAVDLGAVPGDLLVVGGSEGSGAATLVHVMAGRIAPDSGWVLVDGVEQALAPPFVDRAVLSDPRLFASGSEAAVWALDVEAPMVFLHQPIADLAPDRADDLLARWRRRADDGVLVMMALEDPTPALAHATALAVMLAGRLMATGRPEATARAGTGLHAFGPRSTHRAELERRLLERRLHSVRARQMTNAS